jgi:hypothetical protein
MRLTQDDCPSVSVSRMRALGEVREDMARVRVTIAGVSREVLLWHLRFPNGGGWSFFLCPSCGRRARVLKLNERIACWRCTRFEGRPLAYRVWQGTGRADRAAETTGFRRPARVKRAWAHARQGLADGAGSAARSGRRGVKGAKDALAKEAGRFRELRSSRS